jgi:hypothetical protein
LGALAPNKRSCFVYFLGENVKVVSSSLSQREKQKKKVDQYSLTGDFIKTWSSVSEAAKAIGGQSSNIASCTAGRRKTAYGYIWRYGNV